MLQAGNVATQVSAAVKHCGSMLTNQHLTSAKFPSQSEKQYYSYAMIPLDNPCLGTAMPLSSPT